MSGRYDNYILSADLITAAGNWHGWHHPLADIDDWNFNSAGDLQAYCDHKIALLAADPAFAGGKCELGIFDDDGRKVAGGMKDRREER